MSTDSNANTRPRTDAPNTHQLAAELGVDAELLDRFVADHPNPTAPIVLGWAHRTGRLQAAPEHLRDDVAAWIDARPSRDALDDVDAEAALRADSLRAIVGGEE